MIWILAAAVAACAIAVAYVAGRRGRSEARRLASLGVVDSHRQSRME